MESVNGTVHNCTSLSFKTNAQLFNLPKGITQAPLYSKH